MYLELFTINAYLLKGQRGAFALEHVYSPVISALRGDPIWRSAKKNAECQNTASSHCVSSSENEVVIASLGDVTAPRTFRAGCISVPSTVTVRSSEAQPCLTLSISFTFLNKSRFVVQRHHSGRERPAAHYLRVETPCNLLARLLETLNRVPTLELEQQTWVYFITLAPTAWLTCRVSLSLCPPS